MAETCFESGLPIGRSGRDKAGVAYKEAGIACYKAGVAYKEAGASREGA